MIAITAFAADLIKWIKERNRRAGHSPWSCRREGKLPPLHSHGIDSASSCSSKWSGFALGYFSTRILLWFYFVSVCVFLCNYHLSWLTILIEFSNAVCSGWECSSNRAPVHYNSRAKRRDETDDSFCKENIKGHWQVVWWPQTCCSKVQHAFNYPKKSATLFVFFYSRISCRRLCQS